MEFGDKTTQKAIIADALAHHVRTITEDARSQSLLITTITVLLQTARYGDYSLRGGVLPIVLPLPSAHTNYCLRHAMLALDSLFEAEVPYAKVGCIASGLMPDSYLSKSLWGSEPAEIDALDQVLDTLNARFGRDRIRLGQFTKVPSWQTKQTLLSPAYTTSWHQLKTVKTK